MPVPQRDASIPTGAFGTELTATDEDIALVHLPVAVAVAVITSLLARVSPVLVHTPPVTVVVPCETPPLNTVMTVPLASLLVPLTDVEPAHIGEVITGVADTLCTLIVTVLLLVRKAQPTVFIVTVVEPTLAKVVVEKFHVMPLTHVRVAN